MNTPLILISPSTQSRGVEFLDGSLSLSDRYPAAIIAGGGMPWVMACVPDADFIADCVRRCDGILLTGGDDIQPQLYRESVPPHLARTVGPTAPQRDWAELLLIAAAFRQCKPLFAICRGMQLANVALGGTLFVDIRSQVPQALRHNRMDQKDGLVHPAALATGSRMEKIFGASSISVNSTHHQAVDGLAGHLCVTARSPDGIVEAIELAPTEAGLMPFFLGVQFHPERLYPKHPEFLGLFQCFVRACGS